MGASCPTRLDWPRDLTRNAPRTSRGEPTTHGSQPVPDTDDMPVASAGASSRPSTRDRLLQAALDATEAEAFSNLSLRALTRKVGIVPTGFYRHFPDMDTLGLELVDEAFGTLQGMIRSVRDDPMPPEDMIRGSVDVLFAAVDERPSHFRFIAREINGGSRVLRDAIRDRLAAFTDELSDDLERLPIIGDWSEPDRRMFAHLLVTVMVAAAAEVVQYPDERDVIVHRTEQQLRLAVLAVPHWNP
jgi:AcrR family transcriptional regulator